MTLRLASVPSRALRFISLDTATPISKVLPTDDPLVYDLGNAGKAVQVFVNEVCVIPSLPVVRGRVTLPATVNAATPPPVPVVTPAPVAPPKAQRKTKKTPPKQGLTISIDGQAVEVTGVMVHHEEDQTCLLLDPQSPTLSRERRLAIVHDHILGMGVDVSLYHDVLTPISHQATEAFRELLDGLSFHATTEPGEGCHQISATLVFGKPHDTAWIWVNHCLIGRSLPRSIHAVRAQAHVGIVENARKMVQEYDAIGAGNLHAHLEELVDLLCVATPAMRAEFESLVAKAPKDTHLLVSLLHFGPKLGAAAWELPTAYEMVPFPGHKEAPNTYQARGVKSLEMHGIQEWHLAVRYAWYGQGGDVYNAWFVSKDKALCLDNLASHTLHIQEGDVFPGMLDGKGARAYVYVMGRCVLSMPTKRVHLDAHMKQLTPQYVWADIRNDPFKALCAAEVGDDHAQRGLVDLAPISCEIVP